MERREVLGLLRRCLASKLATQGKLVHQRILALGFQNDLNLCRNLIPLYFSCLNYPYATLVFNGLLENNHRIADISLWNGLLAAYSRSFMYTEALDLFVRLLRDPYLGPDSFTYPSVLKACGGLGMVRLGRMVHTHLVKTRLLRDTTVASSLAGLYGACGWLRECLKVFDEIPERDVACWNTVISCYYHNGEAGEVLRVFESMREARVGASSVTLTIALCACARVEDFEKGKEIHLDLVRRGVRLDGFVSSALVDMYGKCGCVEMAREVFEQMARKTVVAWNSMMSAYSRIGDSKQCIDLFRRMTLDGTGPKLTTLSIILMACSRSAQLYYGKSVHGYIIRTGIKVDAFVNNALVDLYFNCGNVHTAKSVFQVMPAADVASWNVMINGYVKMGDYCEALGIYGEMKAARAKPDAMTFASILPACSQLAALEKGKEIHNSVVGHGLEANGVVMGALLDMYAKCGAIDEALQIFHKLPKRDLVSWTSMITAYGTHGRALEALDLFREMQHDGKIPDGVTYLAVLSSCSHAGLVDEGHHYFLEMMEKYNIKPKIEHYTCLIDILGRAGRLQEAYRILQDTEEVRENVELLSTLFSACCLHKEEELGQELAKILTEKHPDNPSIYIGLSNLNASLKEWGEVRKARLKMKELGLKKNPGLSWIEIGNTIHAFFSEDKLHPRAEMVLKSLSILTNHVEVGESMNLEGDSYGFLKILSLDANSGLSHHKAGHCKVY